MKNKINQNGGITLVALVITVIITLILAGTAISLITGEDGLFAKANHAASLYNQKAKEEAELLNQILAGNYIGSYTGNTGDNTPVLPENNAQNPQPAGTIVALKDGWGTQTVNYTNTNGGIEVTGLTTVATVYAVSVGNGDTVPVPKDFYYVGGSLSNGVIISDNPQDRYGYNPETGNTNDTTLDKTTYAYTTSLIGNQFVWIPCSTGEYHKTSSWNTTTQTNSALGNAWWDTTTPKSELSQIEKYGGFYVARYEAGLGISESRNNIIHTGSEQIYNKAGIPQSKAGVIPWMFIDWDKSKANAESMYNNTYVSSGLITGTQWDVILNKMVEKNAITASDLTDSNGWGNYRNKQLTYTGRKAIADYKKTNTNYWTLKPFEENVTTNGTKNTYDANTYCEVLTTGASSTTERYHIFDLAGNLWEWTEEASFYGGNTSTQYRVVRGGGYINASSGAPVCYRNGDNPVSGTNFLIGFRAVLYIK